MSFQFEISSQENVARDWASSLRNVGAEWLEYFGRQTLDKTAETFDALAHGGSFRGVAWNAFKRKPSDRRGGWNARLLDDTGALKSSVGGTFEADGSAVKIGATAPYAARQQATRPFLFFQTPQDAQTAARIAAEFIQRALSKE